MKKTTKPCRNCGKEFTPYSSLDKFCKKWCMIEFEKTKTREKKAKKKAWIPALSKLADLLWAKYIRTKAWKCEYCGSIDNLNRHHIFTRHSRNTRWEEINWICLCRKHHTFSDEWSAHKTPVEFTYWLEENRWKEFIDNLRSKANKPLKVTVEYLQEKIKEFKID